MMSKDALGHVGNSKRGESDVNQAFMNAIGFPRTVNWWRRRGLNPRPQVLHFRYYMLRLRF